MKPFGVIDRHRWMSLKKLVRHRKYEVSKKSHGHNIEILAFSLNQIGTNQGSLLLIHRGETSLLKTPYFTATQTNRDPQALK